MAPGISDRLVSDSGPPMASTRLHHWPACAEGNEKGRPPGSQFKVSKRKARLTSTRSAHQRGAYCRDALYVIDDLEGRSQGCTERAACRTLSEILSARALLNIVKCNSARVSSKRRI